MDNIVWNRPMIVLNNIVIMPYFLTSGCDQQGIL